MFCIKRGNVFVKTPKHSKTALSSFQSFTLSVSLKEQKSVEKFFIIYYNI